MKLLAILITFVVLVKGQDPPECQGPWCPIKCPPGTYRYSVGCDYRQPEPTCTNPNPEKETAMICDYQACYCNPPKVRNEKTKECVNLCDCPGKPVTPVTPKTPVTPRTPVTPITPVTPRKPVTPRTPVIPRTPVTPRKPVTPRAPVTEEPCLPEYE